MAIIDSPIYTKQRQSEDTRPIRICIMPDGSKRVPLIELVLKDDSDPRIVNEIENLFNVLMQAIVIYTND